MQEQNEMQIPQLIVVPKQFGGIWPPLLCFMLGMLNFALLVNAVNVYRQQNSDTQQKTLYRNTGYVGRKNDF